MVDTSSSTYILYKDAFQKLELIMTYLSPMSSTLAGFIGDTIIPLGTISTLNRLRAVVSTYHYAIKFRTRARVGELRNDPWESRRCYLIMIMLSKKSKVRHPNHTKTTMPPSLDKPLVDLKEAPERPSGLEPIE
ncbi:hypothetical protein BHM03_00000442 [Ensete ventricosum]|uniref:Uncharacterized protein n=1 Tax=Ensete ventricosum TaxID=4639 RepID=A0A445M8J6_ENSVE|nr:hypothetical protein BHM03_00000442 [Ensete ventricosum]